MKSTVRLELDAEAAKRGYSPDQDDTDDDLRSIVHQRAIVLPLDHTTSEQRRQVA